MTDTSATQRTTRRTKPRVTEHIKAEIERLHTEEGLTAREIEDRLDAARADADDYIPDGRTIRRYVADVKSQGEPWSLGDSPDAKQPKIDPADAPLILEALAATPGFRFRLSREQAAWIVRVRKAAPDLTPRTARTLANIYAAYTQQKRDTWSLDALLAFAPWRNSVALAHYRDALEERRIPVAPVFWAAAREIKDLWRRMGFTSWLVAAATSYDELRDMDERNLRGETVDLPDAEQEEKSEHLR